jgi:hypothetical protein
VVDITDINDRVIMKDSVSDLSMIMFLLSDKNFVEF